MGRKGKPLSAAHKAAISRALKGNKNARSSSPQLEARRRGSGSRFISGHIASLGGGRKMNPLVFQYYKERNAIVLRNATDVAAGRAKPMSSARVNKIAVANTKWVRKSKMPKKSPSARASRVARRNFVLYD